MTVSGPAGKKRRWLWITAAVVLLVGAGGGWYAYRSRTATRDPILMAVSRLPKPNAGLPDGWDVRPWTRDSGVVVSDLGRAVRVGALLLDLEVAVRAQGDQIAPVARDIASYLSDVPAGAPIIAFLNEAAMRPKMKSDDMSFRLVRVRNAARRLLDKDFVAIGAWAEGGRLAGLSGGSYPKLNENLVTRASGNTAASDDIRSALSEYASASGDSTYTRLLSRLSR